MTRGNFEKKNPATGVADKHRAAALKSKGKGISNAEIKPDEDKVRYQELEELYDLEEKDAKLIEAEVGGKITEIVEEDWGEGNWVKEYSFDNEEEWLVFDNESDAEEVATFRVEEDIEDTPGIIPVWHLTSNLEPEKTESTFREIYDESNSGYVDGIEDEDDDEYTNRLASEMYEQDIITYEEATDEDFDLEDKKEEMIDKMTDSAINEGDYGFEYYKSNFGEDEAFKIMNNMSLVDTKEAAKEIVYQYGIANQLGRYDNRQVDLDNGMVMYRTD